MLASAVSTAPLELMRQFNALQSNRVQTYRDFERGFDDYIAKAKTPTEYERLVQDITQKFASISRDIQGVEQRLRDQDQIGLAMMIREVQDLEKTKLQATVKYQMSKAESVFGERDYQGDLEQFQETIGQQHYTFVEEVVEQGGSTLMYRDDLSPCTRQVTFSLIDDAYAEVFTLFSSQAAHTWRHNFHVTQKAPKVDYTLGDRTITISQDNSALGRLGVTGVVVWDSAVVLSGLCERGVFEVRNRACLELGSGTGLFGIVLATLGARTIVLTDRFDELKHAEKNISRNIKEAEERARIQLVEYEWGSNSTSIFDALPCNEEAGGEEMAKRSGWVDYIFASDCVYNEHIVPYLVETFKNFCSESNSRGSVRCAATKTSAIEMRLWPENTTLVVIAQELRSDSVHLEFLEQMIQAGFRMARLEDIGDVVQNSAVCLYVAWLET
ncbi:hypothetical protein SpCBS45565_g06560 [Spizellomyces sp. 'palustris']|nr:hypothetical protein SpCBS45565_g06560 [Spizellomyces sp. 'palustris']